MDSQQDAVQEHVKLDKALNHGSVVIAAITSCTNTSNPSVLVAAGLLAKKAVEKGLTVPAWVKTSLAPGSLVVTEYLTRSGLMPYLEKLKFNVVGYGCTTCIGNSGPLPQEVSDVVIEKDLVVASVLSGNRNFEGRINSEVRANYLMSPPLVVAYALAGRIDLDRLQRAAGLRTERQAHSRFTSRTSGRRRKKWMRWFASTSPAISSAALTATSSRATNAGAACTFPKARPSPGTSNRPTSRTRRTSRTCRRSPNR